VTSCTPVITNKTNSVIDNALVTIKNGMDIHVKDFLGRTPLHSAFMLGKVDMARALINLGLDANEKDNYGKTPLDLAKEMKSIVMDDIK
jgi:ankyrin repeat protein